MRNWYQYINCQGHLHEQVFCHTCAYRTILPFYHKVTGFHRNLLFLLPLCHSMVSYAYHSSLSLILHLREQEIIQQYFQGSKMTSHLEKSYGHTHISLKTLKVQVIWLLLETNIIEIEGLFPSMGVAPVTVITGFCLPKYVCPCECSFLQQNSPDILSQII